MEIKVGGSARCAIHTFTHHSSIAQELEGKGVWVEGIKKKKE